MATVTLKDIHKIYDPNVHVVKGVELDIQDGEFMVLVGPSGCGKSTLLRMIAGLEEVTRGELRIGDRVVNDVRPRDRDVAMVFQSYALYPHMSVRANMAFGLKVRKMAREEIDKRIEEAARILDITHLLDRLPKQLSGGQRQRVAMGRAIVRQPQVYLFDEPLSNLDASLHSQMRVELKKMHQTFGVTMIYVTHDQIEAMTMADRIALVHEGIIQQIGPPSELYDHPGTLFVAGFIGSPAMNFLEASVEDGMLVGDGFSLALPQGTQLTAQQITVGVRPHDFVLDSSPQPQLRARVQVIEPLGWEAHVHLEVGGRQMVARFDGVEAAQLKPGQEIGLAPTPGKLHLFDRESGRRLEG